MVIGSFLAACLLYLYYVILTRAEITSYVWGAMAVLLVEGIMFFALGRDCAFSVWQRHYGDEKGFFELFLPRRLARVAFPVLLMISGVAFLLITARALR